MNVKNITVSGCIYVSANGLLVFSLCNISEPIDGLQECYNNILYSYAKEDEY